MQNGRLYIYREDRTYGSKGEPTFIAESSPAFNASEYLHLPIITEEEFRRVEKKWKTKKT